MKENKDKIEYHEKIICKYCDKEASIFLEKCPNCGNDLFITCPVCGRKLDDDETSCCGICLTCS